MIVTVFLKELKDTLRDRRTLIAMLVIPILVFPLILGIMTSVTRSMEKSQKEDVFNVALIGNEHSEFTRLISSVPEELGPKSLVFLSDTTGLKDLIKKDSIQLAFVSPTDFDETEKMDEQNFIHIYFQGTNLGTKDRADAYLDFVSSDLLENRLKKRSINPLIMEPLIPIHHNVASDKEMLGKLVGGFLPYLFIIFGFIGCMYPAIDLFTGEKERKTLETLLTAPIARWKILFGKMLVVVLSGIAAATFALVGLYLSLDVFQLVEDKTILDLIRSILSPSFIGMLYLLLLPLTVFFAGLMIPLTVYAKTFKEAQSILTPINFIVILPALVGFLPSIELTAMTALIPIVNIVLSTKELVAGTLNPLLLLLSFSVMVVFACISVFVSYRQFGKESNIVS